MERDELVRALQEISTKNSVSTWKREVCLSAADLIEEQAREIEALRKQNENLQATATKFATELQPKPQWVSVTERLPEPGKRVLATDGGFVGEFYLSERGQWKRYNVNDHSLLMALDILWWTNFPEAPKEGT